MKKILIIIDKPDWAFDIIASNLIKNNNQGYEIYKKISKDKNFYFYLRDNHKSFDLIYFMNWSNAAKIISPLSYLNIKNTRIEIKYKIILKKYSFLNYEKVIAGFHSHHSFDGYKSTPNNNIKPGKNLIKFLNKFKMINCVSNRLFNLLESNGVKKLRYTPNGVDEKKFYSKKNLFTDSRIKVGCSGTLARDDKEGISKFILPLKKISWLDLKIAVPQNNLYVKHDKMPDFLNELDIYILASKSEGFPLKLLEAASCGRVCISTKVGGAEELIEDGIDGYFFDRNLNDLIAVLKHIKENKNLQEKKVYLMRKKIEKNWTWKIVSTKWYNFFQENLIN